MGQLDLFATDEMYLVGAVIGLSFNYVPKVGVFSLDIMKALTYTSSITIK